MNTSSNHSQVSEINSRTQYIIHGILMPIISGFGLCGNILGIVYVISLNTRQRQYTFYLLLISLFLLDLTFIIMATIVFSLREIFPDLYIQPNNIASTYLDRWSLPMAHLGLFGSIYFTVALCFERYMAICSPLFYRTKRRHSCLYILTILLFIVCVNVPRFLELRIQEDEGVTKLCVSNLRKNRTYYYIYGVIFKFLLQYIIPYPILIVLNTKIWKALRVQTEIGVSALPKACLNIHLSSNSTTRRKTHSELAKMSLIIVIALMVCLPIGFVNDIFEVYNGIQEVKKCFKFLEHQESKKIIRKI